jgi:hypothetical protein
MTRRSVTCPSCEIEITYDPEAGTGPSEYLRAGECPACGYELGQPDAVADGSISILPGSVGGETRIQESGSPTTLLEETTDSVIDASDFPRIELTVNVDTEDGIDGRLTAGDFQIYENDVRQEVVEFDFSTASLDLVVVFDDTGSMQSEIDAMQAGVKELTDEVAAKEIDARYALVSFKDDPEIDLRVTPSPRELKDAVDALSAEGGGDAPEDSFGAVMKGLELDLREDARPVFVTITDTTSHYRGETVSEHPHLGRMSDTMFSAFDSAGDSDYIHDEVADALAGADVSFIAVAPDIDHPKCSIKSLAGTVDGLWTDIGERSFDAVLDRIITVLSSTYTLTYYSSGDPGASVPVRVEYEDPTAGTLATSARLQVPRNAGTTASTTGTAPSSAGTSSSTAGPATSNKQTGTARSGQPANDVPTDSDRAGGQSRSSERAGHGTDQRGTGSATTGRTAKFCPSCGSDLREFNSPSFCPECGSDIDF